MINTDNLKKMSETKGYSFSDDGEFAEMYLDLACYEGITSSIDGVSYFFYQGSMDVIRDMVLRVDHEWPQWFEDDTPIFCGFYDGKPVSFCIVEPDDDSILSIPGVKVGSIGCVGTMPEFRRRGIGLRMVDLATVYLKENGFDKAYIHYTAIEKWYGKLCYEVFARFDLPHGD